MQLRAKVSRLHVVLRKKKKGCECVWKGGGVNSGEVSHTAIDVERSLHWETDEIIKKRALRHCDVGEHAACAQRLDDLSCERTDPSLTWVSFA